MKVKPSVRMKLNVKLHTLSLQYWDAIPIQGIDTILRSEGFMLLQEDGTEWEGLLCGREGKADFQYGAENSILVLTWYKMPSNRYEIVAYVS